MALPNRLSSVNNSVSALQYRLKHLKQVLKKSNVIWFGKMFMQREDGSLDIAGVERVKLIIFSECQLPSVAKANLRILPAVDDFLPTLFILIGISFISY